MLGDYDPEDFDRYITGNWGEDQYPDDYPDEGDWPAEDGEPDDDYICDDGDDTPW